MDSVCPASVYSGSSSPFPSTVGTFLSGTTSSLLSNVTTDSPSVRNVPEFTSLTFTKPVISLTTSKTYTVNPFSVTAVVIEANPTLSSRYTPLISAVGNSQINAAIPKLTSSQLANIYTTLTSKKVSSAANARLAIIPADMYKSTNLSGKVSDLSESISYDLIYSMQYEFCYYIKYFTILYNDYVTILNKTTVTSPATGFTEAKQTALAETIVNNLTTTKARIVDITDIAAYIGNKQTADLRTMNDAINTFVTSTQSSVNALNANLSGLLSKDKESNLRSRQLAFSEEKNAYANQLLAMYGFANLIALGLLFYIYKS